MDHGTLDSSSALVAHGWRKSLVLLVVLLIFIAYHPAGRPQDLGGGADAPRPQRRRARWACCSPSPTC